MPRDRVTKALIAEASRNRLTDVILVLGEGKQAIADYFAPHPSLEAVLAANGDTRSLATIKRAANLATIHQVEQLEPRGLGDAVAHGERFAGGGPLAVLLCCDRVHERRGVQGPVVGGSEWHR